MKTNKYIQAAEEYTSLGYSEELTENNFFAPAEEDYVTADQVYYEESDIEDWDIS